VEVRRARRCFELCEEAGHLWHAQNAAAGVETRFHCVALVAAEAMAGGDAGRDGFHPSGDGPLGVAQDARAKQDGRTMEWLRFSREVEGAQRTVGI